MTPEQAINLIENIKANAPDKLVQAANTVALEAARWAQQALNRDRQLLLRIKRIEEALHIEEPAQPAQAEATATAETPTEFDGVDPSALKGKDLERYMDAMTSGLPGNPNAPVAKNEPPPMSPEAAERIVAEDQAKTKASAKQNGAKA